MIYPIHFSAHNQSPAPPYTVCSCIHKHTHTLSLLVSTYPAGLRDRTAWSLQSQLFASSQKHGQIILMRRNIILLHIMHLLPTICPHVYTMFERHVINPEWGKGSHYLKNKHLNLCRMCFRQFSSTFARGTK